MPKLFSMNLKPILGAGALYLLLFFMACSDPTLVGAGLLDEDRAEVGFTDTFTLRGATELSEPLRTFSPFVVQRLDRMLFGDFRDPQFGQAKSTLNLQFLPLFDPNNIPVFEDMMGVDSVVLILPYTRGGFYGKTEGETFTMKVAELQEFLNEDEEYFSDRKAAASSEALVNHEFTATLDSIEHIDYIGTDPDTLSFPQLRVPLPVALGDSLVSVYSLDTLAYLNSNQFFSYFPGLQLEAVTETPGMLAFTLLSIRAGVHIYYRDSIDTPRRYQYVFNATNAVQYAEFEHDPQGTLGLELVENGSENDSLLYIQGMAGLRSKVTLPDLSVLNNVAINQAYLDLYVARTEALDTATYPLARQLVLRAENDVGEEEFVEDVILVDAQQGSWESLFGGQPEYIESERAIRYRMSVSNYIQEVLEGRMSNEFYIIPIENNDLSPVKRGEIAERVILHGGTHPELAMKLAITFTRL